jgi:putative copper export protein
MVVLSQALLYPAFAFLIGGLFITIIPPHLRPKIYLLRNSLMIVLGSVVFLSFVPVLAVIRHLSLVFELQFIEAMQQVLWSFNIGQVWLVTIFVSALLMIVLKINKNRNHLLNYVAFFLALALVVTMSKGSHAASLQPTFGFLANGLHLLSVSLWVGPLLVIGLYAKDESHWFSFLKWYTPLAIICVLSLAGSGMLLMNWIVPDYQNSLMLSYGQYLLVKHILFALIILFGFLNGFIIRKKLKKEPTFQPKKWLRLEGIFIVFVFFVTSLMTETTPPHNVSLTLERVQPAKLFELFHGPVGALSNVTFSGNVFSLVFAIIVFLGVGIVFLAIRKKGSVFLGAIGGVVIVMSSYSLVMTSISVETTFSSEGIPYSTIEEVIRLGHKDNDELLIFQTSEHAVNLINVLYSVNQSQLISELVYKSEAGYQRISDSRLIIGGTPISDAEHKIRTFLITDGPWHQKGTSFTYVTFGIIQDPVNVVDVEIRYQGKFKKVLVKNQTFFSVSSSIEQWDQLHPIIFYDESGKEIGAYMRDVMESEAYCH